MQQHKAKTKHPKNIFSHAEVAVVNRDEVCEGREGLASLLPRAEDPLKHERVRVLKECVVHRRIVSQACCMQDEVFDAYTNMYARGARGKGEGARLQSAIGGGWTGGRQRIIA